MSGKKIAMIFGVILVILGVLGFIGGVGIVGAEGLFLTDTAHDLVHLVAGLILVLVAWKSPASSGMWLKVLGIIFLLLAVIGFFTGEGMLLGFAEAGMSGHILHLVLGVIFLWAGFKGGGRGEMAMGNTGGMA